MKIAIVTGATGGMGRIMSRRLAHEGYLVIMACKDNPENNIFKNLSADFPSQIRYAHLDLASINSIINFANHIRATYPIVDLLLNNAGVLSHGAEVTQDGFEKTVGINYIGTVMLTEMLSPLFKKGSRIINMASLSYSWFSLNKNFSRPLQPKQFNRFKTYSNSKLALVYYTIDKAKEWETEGISINCADPGIVNTGIITMGNKIIDTLCNYFFRPIIQSPDKGVFTMLYLALSVDVEGVSGAFYKKKKKIAIPNKILHHPQREWLRSITQSILIQHHINSE